MGRYSVIFVVFLLLTSLQVMVRGNKLVAGLMDVQMVFIPLTPDGLTWTTHLYSQAGSILWPGTSAEGWVG